MPTLEFRKDGYITKQCSRAEISKDGLVVLEHQIDFTGVVLAPDGQSVPRFQIWTAFERTVAARRPTAVETQLVSERSGRFTVRLNQEGRVLLGVHADGYADKEQSVVVHRAGTSCTVVLEAGTAVTGRIRAVAGGLKDLEARLVVRRDRVSTPREAFEKRTTHWGCHIGTVSPDGLVRFDNIRPDRYILRVSGPNVSSTALVLDVPASGLDLGEIRLAGTGRMTGRLFRPAGDGGGIAPFKSYTLEYPDPSSIHTISKVGFTSGLSFASDAEFTSDEDGRFSVEGLPVGVVTVHVPETIGHVTSYNYYHAQICEGQTTELRMFDADRGPPQPLAIRVGDGSRAQLQTGEGIVPGRAVDAGERPELRFWSRLTPRSANPLSFADFDRLELEANGDGMLPDASPGQYQLSLIRGGRSFAREICVLKQNIVVPSASLPIRLSLGCGSIIGRVQLRVADTRSEKLATSSRPGDDVFFSDVELATMGVEVITVAKIANGLIRRTFCEHDGNFCVPYLDPGVYSIFAHSAEQGWSRVDDVKVGANVQDVGVRRLAGGGTIRGSVSFRRPCPVPDEIGATGPLGVPMRVRLNSSSDLRTFEFRELWPGPWTITLRSRGQVLASATTELSGSEEKMIDLVTRAD